MKKYLKAGAIALVIIALCFAYAHIDKMHAVFDENVDPSFYTSTEVGTKKEFVQKFTSEEKALDGVALKFTTTGEKLDKVNLVYSIEDEQGRVLSSGILEGSKFKNQKYNKLEVVRIDNAKDRTFVFRCHMENNDSENGISIYEEGKTLVMKYYMSRFDFETFAIACVLCLYVIVFMNILFKMFKE